jgi:hypothetical protein
VFQKPLCIPEKLYPWKVIISEVLDLLEQYLFKSKQWSCFLIKQGISAYQLLPASYPSLSPCVLLNPRSPLLVFLPLILLSCPPFGHLFTLLSLTDL